MFLDYFDKVFVINLDKRPDRLERFKNRIKILGESLGTTVDKFKAVDGTKIPESERNNWSAGAAGCKLSHINLIAECREKKYKSVLILEDDVTFVSDFPSKFQELMGAVPDSWDMVYFGGNQQPGSLIPYKGICHKVKVYSTHAYAVKDTMYDLIVDYIGPQSCPIDVAYVGEIHRHDKYQVFGAYPQIAGQEIGYSDIEERPVDHRRVLGDIK